MAPADRDKAYGGGSSNDTYNGQTSGPNQGLGNGGNSSGMPDGGKNNGGSSAGSGSGGSSGGGTDTVESSANYTLGANVENLTPKGSKVSETEYSIWRAAGVCATAYKLADGSRVHRLSRVQRQVLRSV